jgi:putative endonuclease
MLGPMERQFFVYIMTNQRHTVLYTGITSDLPRRAHEHRTKSIPGFTARYNLNKLIFYESAPTAETAILREKQIKAGSRARKMALIEAMNPTWRDLFGDIASG